jgi:predicted Zn finger-like uncharacterized protein
MSAMIVQCPSCEVRFNLQQDRIPEKGARVRCSKCQHRFFVARDGAISALQDGADGGTSGSASASRMRTTHTTSTERTAPSPSGGVHAETGPSAGDRGGATPADSGALTHPPRGRPARRATEAPASPPRAPIAADRARARPTVRLGDDASDTPSRSPWSNRAAPDPEEDPSLENPEFLYEPPTETAGSRHSFVAAAEDPDLFEKGADAPSPPSHSATPEGSAPGAPSAAAPRSSTVDDDAIPDIRAQRDEMAAQRALAALDIAERETYGAPPAEGDDETGTLAARARLRAVSDLSNPEADAAPAPPQRSPRAPAQPPAPAAPSVQPGGVVPFELDAGLDDAPDLEQSVGTWATETARPAASARPATTYVANSAAVHVSSASPASAVAAAAESPAWLARGEPLSSSRAALALAWVAGAALLLGASRQLAVHAWPRPAPDTLAVGADASGTEWTATQLASARVADAGGSILIVEGRLTASGGGATPRLRATFVDARGVPVGVAPIAIHGRIADGARTPAALRALLARPSPTWSRPAAGGAPADESAASAGRGTASDPQAASGDDASGGTAPDDAERSVGPGEVARGILEPDAGDDWFTVLAPSASPEVAELTLEVVD